MKYFKRNWEETRGNEFGDWGTSVWYFETDDQGFPTRQIEVYQNGRVLKYSEERLTDEFGGLGDQALDLEEFEDFKITQSAFENKWNE
jgi:hypothetical protein